MTSEYLKNFEMLNTTTDSIFDLNDYGVLIILNDGTNLTNWDEIKYVDEILYISEDLSSCNDLRSRYRRFSSLEAIVAKNVTANATSLDHVFGGCYSLKELSLINWDVSKVTSMQGMFSYCKSLEDITFLKDWDVSNVRKMEAMFSSCESLRGLSPLANWNVSNVEHMDDMFGFCRNLEDLSPLAEWDVSNLASVEGMFFYCESLRDASALKDWDVSNLNENYIGGMFEGCDIGLDLSFFKDLNQEALRDRGWNFAGWRR